LTRGNLKPNEWAEQLSRTLDWGDEDWHWETDMTGITAIANIIPEMRAVSSVNLLLNGIDVDQAKELVGILKEHPTLKSLCGNKGNDTELDMSGKMHGTGDAIMLIPEIVDNGTLTCLDVSGNSLVSDSGWFNVDNHGFKKGDMVVDYNGVQCAVSMATDSSYKVRDIGGMLALADGIRENVVLTSLNMSANRLKGAEAGKALGDAIAANTVLKELDISGGEYRSEQGDVGFVQTFAVGLRDNRALTTLMFGDKQVVTMTTEMAEANLRGKLQPQEAQVVAAFLPKCT
jgi:hypothetical protein